MGLLYLRYLKCILYVLKVQVLNNSLIHMIHLTSFAGEHLQIPHIWTHVINTQDCTSSRFDMIFDFICMISEIKSSRFYGLCMGQVVGWFLFLPRPARRAPGGGGDSLGLRAVQEQRKQAWHKGEVFERMELPIVGPSYGKLPILFPYHSHVFRGSYGSARSDFVFFIWGEYLINEIGTPIAKSSPRECLNRNRWTNVAIVSCVFRPEKVKDRPPQVFRIKPNEITAALSGAGWFCSLQTIDWMMRSEWMLYLYVFVIFHANERFVPQEDEHRTDNPSRTWLQSVKL